MSGTKLTAVTVGSVCLAYTIMLAKWRVENNSKDRNFVWEKTVCPGKNGGVLLGKKR